MDLFNAFKSPFTLFSSSPLELSTTPSLKFKFRTEEIEDYTTTEEIANIS